MKVWSFRVGPTPVRPVGPDKVELREFYKDYTPPRRVFGPQIARPGSRAISSRSRLRRSYQYVRTATPSPPRENSFQQGSRFPIESVGTLSWGTSRKAPVD